MAEKERAFLLFFGKAKQNVCDHFAHSVFAFWGGFQRRATALLGRKNPKKPAVSWHTILLARSSVLYLCAAAGGKGGSRLPQTDIFYERRAGAIRALSGDFSKTACPTKEQKGHG